MNDYDGQPKRLVSAISEPKIPAALSPVIRGFTGLSQIPVHAYAHWGVAPQLNGCNSSGECQHFIAPSDFATIFDIPALPALAFGFTPRIAIVGRSRASAADISGFESMAGISPQDPNVLIPTDGSDPGESGDLDQLEATIDITRALGTAPNANIDLVTSSDSATQSGLGEAIEYEIDTVLDPIASISFGACESAAGAAATNGWDSLASQAAAEGIAIFVSSGDAGAAGCDTNNATPPATQIKSPNYLCSTSYVTCVGGTEFNDTANPGQYWSGSNQSFLSSALGYIPEGGWNEPTGTNSSGATIYQASSSGGGASSVIAKPSWQTGVGVPADGFRDTPDVAFPSAAHDAYFACYAANGGDCSKGYFEYFYGTSAAAPSMAAISAILNEFTQQSQGNLNPLLYRLASDPSSGVFHDTTVETSGVSSCSLSTPSMCNNSTPSPTALTGGLSGYQLTTGYDLVTGLGSIDVGQLINAAKGPLLPNATVAIALNSNAFTTAQTFTVSVAVTGNGPIPTGTVELFEDDGLVSVSESLADGKAVFSDESISVPETTPYTRATLETLTIALASRTRRKP